MTRALALIVGLVSFTLAACQGTDVAPGATPDTVYRLRGQPTRVIGGEAARGADATWIYHEEPVLAPNESILGGFRRRVVYDPVKHTDNVIVEPIDTRTQPNLVTHDVRVTFRGGRVVDVERVASPSPNG